MADTFLKRKISFKRLWELYSRKVPLAGHLFVAVFAIMIIFFKPVQWQHQYYTSVPLAGPLGLLLMPSVTQLSSVWLILLSSAAVTAGALLLSQLSVEPVFTVIWALVLVCATEVVVLSSQLWIESAVMFLLLILILIARRIRYGSDIYVNILFAVMLIALALIYLPGLLLVPLYVNFAIGKKIPDLKKRVFYALIIGITVAVAVTGVALISNTFFWTGITMLSLWKFPLALWTVAVSPGRSIFLYSPVLVIAIMGYRHMEDEIPDFTRFLTGILVVASTGIILLEGTFCRQSWAGEPFIALLPLLMLPAAWLNFNRPLTGYIAVLAVILGIGIQFLLYTPVKVNEWNTGKMSQVYLPDDSLLFQAAGSKIWQ